MTVYESANLVVWPDSGRCTAGGHAEGTYGIAKFGALCKLHTMGESVQETGTEAIASARCIHRLNRGVSGQVQALQG